MKISFTTLSCPDWSWDRIVNEAQRMGYDGLEIRGIEGEMVLSKAEPFLPENIEKTKRMLSEKGLTICCLDTSCVFHSKEEFDKNIKEGKETIDLAEKLQVPYIRVFGNSVPKGSEKKEIMKQIARGLDELGQYAEGKGVTVLLETHGDFTASDDLLEIFQLLDRKNVGILWDIHHPYKASGESMEETYSKLGQYIKHTHIKDSIGPWPNEKLCLVGKGDLPVKECVEILKKNGYDGWLSLEWEKKWHPEIEDPEIALPSYIQFIRDLLKSL